MPSQSRAKGRKGTLFFGLGQVNYMRYLSKAKLSLFRSGPVCQRFAHPDASGFRWSSALATVHGDTSPSPPFPTSGQRKPGRSQRVQPAPACGENNWSTAGRGWALADADSLAWVPNFQDMESACVRSTPKCIWKDDSVLPCCCTESTGWPRFRCRSSGVYKYPFFCWGVCVCKKEKKSKTPNPTFMNIQWFGGLVYLFSFGLRKFSRWRIRAQPRNGRSPWLQTNPKPRWRLSGFDLSHWICLLRTVSLPPDVRCVRLAQAFLD